MKKILKTINFLPAILLSLAVLTISFNPQVVSAQMGIDVVDSYEGSNQRDLPSAIMTIVNYVLVIVGVLALAYLVYGGFLYITSQGDSSQVDKAKSTIINALIGIVVIGVAAALVNFVVGAVAQ